MARVEAGSCLPVPSMLPGTQTVHAFLAYAEVIACLSNGGLVGPVMAMQLNLPLCISSSIDT